MMGHNVFKTPWGGDSVVRGWAHHHIHRILIVVVKRNFGSISDLKWYLSLVLPMCVTNTRMCLCIAHPDVQTELCTHKIVLLLFFFKTFLCFPHLQYSLCNEPLIELSNPGASGSVFYVTKDDEFIIKTVMHKEAEFLQKLLPGYYMVSVCVQCGCWMRSKLRAYVSCLLGGSCEKYGSFLHIYSNEK